MIEIPYLYTTLWAFDLLFKFENKKEININTLNKYREFILNKLKENNIEVENIDNYEELELMLLNNEYLFMQKGNILCLNEEVTLDDLEYNLITLEKEIIESYNIDNALIVEANSNNEVFKLLEMDKVLKQKEFWDRTFTNLEKQIEEFYIKEDYSNNLGVLLYKRSLLLMHMYAKNPALITDRYYFIDYNKNEEESLYNINNEQYPIDLKIYENSEFYEDEEENEEPLIYKLEDIYQYAIFGNNLLFEDKYNDNLTKIQVNEMVEQLKNINLEDINNFLNEEYNLDINEVINPNLEIEDEDFMFFISYIHELNNLIKKGFNNLIKVRSRLLYMLDDVKYCLYDNNNFNKIYNEIIKREVEENSFDFYKNESKYFIEDIFKGINNKILEKLIFTKTYYKLTKNQEIIEILNKYKKDKRYQLIKDIIFDSNNRENNTPRKK